MITSVSIENLRGIREGKLEGLTPLTVLVGPNSSGKSTVLDALLIGAGKKPAACVGFVVRRRSGLLHGARWLLPKGAGDTAATIQVSVDRDGSRSLSLRWSDGIVERSLGDELTAKGAPGPYSSVVAAVRGDIVPGKAVFASDNTCATFDSSKALSHAWMVDQRLSHPLPTLYSRITERGRRQAVRDLVADVVPGLDVIEILTDHENPRLHLTFADRSVPVALAGDGVQTLVRTCLELATQPEGTVLLEEPEAHQHPGAIRQSARAIVAAVRRGIQVVISTHSMELIDALIEALGASDIDKLSLYRLKLVDGGLRSSRLDGEDVSMSRGEIGDDLR